MTRPIKTSDALKEYEALTGLYLDTEGKATIEFGAKFLSNNVAAAYRTHEAKTGPNPEFIDGLERYHKALIYEIKPAISRFVRKVNDEFDIGQTFDRFSGMKRVNHRANAFDQFRRPETIST